MKITHTKLEGCFIIEPTVFEDDRGFFYESYNVQKFQKETGINPQFLQDNIAQSEYGVVRGLHMQSPPYAQAKLVSCLRGRVLDVVVDARKDSPTYGEYVSLELSAENKKQLFVPRGFLHGYSVLYKTALFAYKCDNFYHQPSEVGINPLDKDLQIDWQLKPKDIILSEKDKNAGAFKELEAVNL